MSVFNRLWRRAKPTRDVRLEDHLASMETALQAFSIPAESPETTSNGSVREGAIDFFSEQIVGLNRCLDDMREDKRELEEGIADLEKTLEGYRAGLRALGGVEKFPVVSHEEQESDHRLPALDSPEQTTIMRPKKPKKEVVEENKTD